jgi:hypothetical protein
MPYRLSIVNRKVQLLALFLGLLRPALLSCKGRNFAPAFWCHGNQTHLSAFRSALLAHLRHNQRNHALADCRFCLSYDGIEHAARGLHFVFFRFRRNAFTAWHSSSVAWFGQSRQEGAISNRPTTGNRLFTRAARYREIVAITRRLYLKFSGSGRRTATRRRRPIARSRLHRPAMDSDWPRSRPLRRPA